MCVKTLSHFTAKRFVPVELPVSRSRRGDAVSGRVGLGVVGWGECVQKLEGGGGGAGGGGGGGGGGGAAAT